MSSADPFSSRFEVFGREHNHTVDEINQQAFQKLKRLLDVGEGGDGRVILLRAPRAGYGKTSILQRLACEFDETHHFVRVNLVSGRTTDAAHVLEYVLQALCEVIPESTTLTKLDHLARRVLALGLEPLVSSGEVPCQDREGALLALREQPTETFDFHHDRAVTAHWTKSNFEILGPRLAAELARVSGASLRESSYWVELLFRFATTAPDNVERARLLFETVFRSDLQNQSESAAEERLHGLLSLFGTVTNLVLIVDDTEGLSTSPSDALALASFLTNLSQCCPGSLVLLSVNDDIWESAFVPLLPGGLADRLTEYDVRLNPLTKDEAQDLIKARAGELAEEILEKIDWGSGELYARRVLKAASEAWEELDHSAASSLEVVEDVDDEDSKASAEKEEQPLDEFPDLDDPESSDESPELPTEEDAPVAPAVIAKVSAVDPVESPFSAKKENEERSMTAEQPGDAEDFGAKSDLDEPEPEPEPVVDGEVKGESAEETRAEENPVPVVASIEEGEAEFEDESVADTAVAEQSEQDLQSGQDEQDKVPLSDPTPAGLEEPREDELEEPPQLAEDAPAIALETPGVNPFLAGAPVLPEPEGNPFGADGGEAFSSTTSNQEDEPAPNPFQAGGSSNGAPEPIFANIDSESEPTSEQPVPEQTAESGSKPFFGENPSLEAAAGDEVVLDNVHAGDIKSAHGEEPAEVNPFVAKESPATDENPFTPSFAPPTNGKEEGGLLEGPSFSAPDAIDPASPARPPEPPPLDAPAATEGNAFPPPMPMEPASPFAAGNAPPSPSEATEDSAPEPPAVTPPPLGTSTPAVIDPTLLHQASEELDAQFKQIPTGESPPNPFATPPPVDDQGPAPAHDSPSAPEETPSPFSALGRGPAGTEKNLGEVSSIFSPSNPAEDPLDSSQLKPLLESVDEPIRESAPSAFMPGAPPATPPAAPLSEFGAPFAAGSPPPAEVPSPAPEPTPVPEPELTSFNPVAASSADSPFTAGPNSSQPPAPEPPEPAAEHDGGVFTPIQPTFAPAEPTSFGLPGGVSVPDPTMGPPFGPQSPPAPEPSESGDASTMDSPHAAPRGGESDVYSSSTPFEAPPAEDVETPFKPVAQSATPESPFAKGEPAVLPQRTELPPRKDSATAEETPESSPFEAGKPPFNAPPISPSSAPSAPFKPDENSPFSAIGSPSPEQPPQLAKINPVPPEPSHPAPTPVTSGGDSGDQDKVDELLRQFKERYGRK